MRSVVLGFGKFRFADGRLSKLRTDGGEGLTPTLIKDVKKKTMQHEAAYNIPNLLKEAIQSSELQKLTWGSRWLLGKVEGKLSIEI